MRWWFQRQAVRRDDQDVIAREKRRAELDDVQLGVRERRLKIDAIERVTREETDPVTALEVISIATHRGRLPPQVYTRRKPESSPLETLAMSMLQKRLDEDPTDALERLIERQERLHEAADRLTGRGGRYEDAESGNTLVDVARAVVNSPLGEALGAVLGTQAQQRMADAAASAAQVQVTPRPNAQLADGAAAASPAAALAPSPTGGPRPTSFRVGMALRVLKQLGPADRARWILSQADQHQELAELVEPFLSAEPGAVPLILEAFLTEATGGGADPAVAEWVPLVEYLRENIEWTLETHAEMRAITMDAADAADELVEAN